MLKDRKIFVTGGSSGIGLAVAQLSIGYGAKVTIMGRDQGRLDDAKSQLGKNCRVFSGDVKNSAEVKAAIDYAIAQMGGLDGLVSSAGAQDLSPIHCLSDEAFDSTIRLCLYGTMFALRDASAYMVENGVKGSVVNISSLNSVVPYKNYVPYCAAKGGINMLTKTASLDLAPYGIRVNAVAPGFTETPLTAPFTYAPDMMDKIKSHTPLARWGKPEEIAEAVCFMLSEKAGYITGEILVVDGGMQNTAYPDIFG